MAAERTLYSVLGVDPDAPIEVVKAAFRALAKQYHPDGNGAGSVDATAKFIELQEAYAIISDPQKRADYNETIFTHTSDEAELGDEVNAEINADEVWDARARENPEIVEIHQILARYSSALANRFVLAVENGECGSDPAGYAFEIEKTYFRKYFGESPELQGIARKLLQAGLRPEAQALNKAISDARNENPNLEPWKIRRILSDFEELLEKRTTGIPEHDEQSRAADEDAEGLADDLPNSPPPPPKGPPPTDAAVGGSNRGLLGLIGVVFLLFVLAVVGVIYVGGKQVSSKQESIAADNLAKSNTNLSSDDLAQLPPVELCKGALNSAKDAWNFGSLASVEADNRGLSVDDCRVILGLSTDHANADDHTQSDSKKQFADRIPADNEALSDVEPVPPMPPVAKKQIYDRIVGEQEVAGDAQPLPVVADDKTSQEALSNSSEVQKVDQIPLIEPSSNGGYQADAPASKPSILQSMSSRLLCVSVLASSYESATPAFSSYPANQQRVNEARRRGLTVDDCVAITQTASSEEAFQDPPKPTPIVVRPTEAKPTERRVALVIGNSKYRVLPWLDNPSRDAKAMAESLAKIGFEVNLVLDGTQTDLRLALSEFSRTLGDDTDVALLYYSGHAVQLQENNLLLPVNLDEEDRDEISLSSLSLSEVIQVMNSQRVANKILILDACRNNPLNDTAAHGLATVKAGMGTFIAYSTQPGNVAEDGLKGGNSPYTTALLSALKTPSGSIEDTFKSVRTAVAQATDGRQVPWESSSLVEQFSFSVDGRSTQGTVKDFKESLEGQSESNEATVNLKAKKKVPLEIGYSEGDDAELADMSEEAEAPSVKPKVKPEPEPELEIELPPRLPIPGSDQQGYFVPKPRPKPIEVLMMAAINMQIQPASAPAPDPVKRVSPLAGNTQGYVISPESLTESASLESNVSKKTSLTDNIENGSTTGVPTIPTITASAAGDDLFYWPQQFVFDSNKSQARDGGPERFSSNDSAVADMLPGVGGAQTDKATQSAPRLAAAQIMQESASGKGDMLIVNREGKGSLLVPPVKLGQSE